MATVVKKTYEIKPWSLTTYTRYPNGTTSVPQTHVGSGIITTTRSCNSGIPPFVLHNLYGFDRSVYPVISTNCYYSDEATRGGVIATFYSGTLNRFIALDNGATAPDLSWDIPTRLLNLAVLDMYDNLSEAKVTLGQTLAELRKTSEGVLHSASILLNAARHAKRLNWKGVLKSLGIEGRHQWRASARNAGARWLEVSFGWKPLLNDIDSLLSYAHKAKGKPLIFTASGKKWETVDSSWSRPSPRGAIRNVERKGRRGYTASLLVQVQDAFIVGLSDVGLKPLPVIYELTPWSFLYDYIVPMGSYLNSLGAMDGLIFKSGSFSYLYDVNAKETVFGDFKFGATTYHVDERVAFKITKMGRGIYPSAPRGSLALTQPLTSFTRAGNIIALLAQTLKDLRKN